MDMAKRVRHRRQAAPRLGGARGAAAVLLAVLLLAGCLPRTRVIPHPSPDEEGLRFYRPKPYLLVAPEAGSDGRKVRLSLEYLPDFSEEYAVQIRSGFGINVTTVELEDGWNLVRLHGELDAQIDEQIRAFADLLQAAGKLVPTSQAPEPTAARPQIVVEAANVPLGFYEAVIARGPGGRKRLYGWRYVGFAPFQPCPFDAMGAECLPCQQAGLYGLVFRKGVMVFEPLGEVGARAAGDVRLVPLESPSAGRRTSRGRSVLERLAAQTAALVNARFGTSLDRRHVEAAWKTRGLAVRLVLRPPEADRGVLAASWEAQREALRMDVEAAGRQLTLESNLTVELVLVAEQ